MGPSRPTVAEWGALSLQLAALAVGVFAFGGAHVQGRAWLTAAVALSLAPLPFLARRPRAPFPLLAPGLVWCAWAGLHGVPLPAGVVEALAPLTAWGRSLAGIEIAGPLSVFPEAIPRDLPLIALTVVWAWGMWQLLRTPRAQGAAAAGVVAIASAAASLGIAQRLAGADRVYFFLPIPGGEGAHFFGPLINPNHDGTLYGVGALLAAGLALQLPASARAARALALAAGALLVAATVATGSQGAMLSLAAAGVLTGWLALRRARRQGAATALMAAGWGVVGFVAATGLGWALRHIATLGGHDPGALELRLILWRDVADLFSRSPLAGIGGGGLVWLYPLVKTSRELSLFDHAHNDWLQGVAEQGIPGALILLWALVAGLRALRGGAWGANPRPAWALCFTGAAALPLIHAAVDFPMQIPALALLTATAIPLALAATRPEDHHPPAPPMGLGAMALGILGAAAALALGFVGWGTSYAAHRAEERLTFALDAAPPPGEIPPDPAGPGASDLDAGDLQRAPVFTLEALGQEAHAGARRDLERAHGRLLRAQDLFHAAWGRAPTDHRAARGLGWVRLYLGDLDGARAALEAGAALGPSDPHSWRQLALLARLTHRDADACAAYTRALAVADRPRALPLFEEVDRAWPEGALGCLPADAQVHLWYGARLMEVGRWADARAALDAAWELDHEDPEVLEDLAITLLRLGDVAAARAWTEKAIEAGIAEARGYRLKGDLLMAEGEPAQALAYFRKAHSLEPSATHAARTLAALADLKRWQELETEASQAARALDTGAMTGTPYQVAEVYRLLGLARLRLGDAEGALLPLAASVGALPGHGPAVVLLAEAHAALGDAPRGDEILRAHLAQHPDDWRAWMAVADRARDRGDPEAARDALRRVLEVKPGWPPARKALRELGPPP